MAKPLTELAQRIYARCREDGDCKIWTGCYSDSGMPLMYVSGRKGLRHVRPMLYRELHGEVPEGREITPICGHKGCLDENHLHAMTKRDGSRIHARKGAYGKPASVRKSARTAASKSWITPEIIEQIKAATNGAEAARLTGVSHSHVKNIRRGTARVDYSNPFAGLGA